MTDVASEPVGQVSIARSRDFYWLPVNGQRHAVRGALGDHAPGETAATLCAASVTIPETVAEELWWTWPTCGSCWTHSHR